MSRPVKTYHFKAPLMRREGKGGWYYVLFPYDVALEFGTRGAVRVLGTFNGIPMDWALIPGGDGTHHIVISGEMRRRAGLRLGSEVSIDIRINEEPDSFALPEELAEAFELEPFARAVFEKQTPGYKRGILHWINAAKRPETRAQRAAEILKRLSTGNPVFGGRQGKD